MTRKRTSATDPTRISFRLDPEVGEELARRAKQAGKSPGVFARELFLEALTHVEQQQHQLAIIVQEMTRVAPALEKLHTLPGDLASSVAVLLVHAGKLTPSQARQWVRQTLLLARLKESEPCSPSD